MPDEPPVPGSGDPSRLTPFQRLHLQLAALRSEQGGHSFDGTPLGGDLRGPRHSDGYAELVTRALQYAWTWRGNALRK